MGLREDIKNEEKYNESDRRDFQILLDRYNECDECECGICGLEVKPGNRFIKGHAGKGRKLSEEHKRKISLARIGMKLSEKTKNIRRKCKCGCGKITNPGRKYISGHNMIGSKLSKETKRKISLAGKGMKRSKETKKKISLSRIGMKFSEEHKRNLSLAHVGMKGKRHSEESKLKMSINSMKCRVDGYCDVWSDIEYKEDLRGGHCEDCSITVEKSLEKYGHNLNLHHKDGNKKNCNPTNFSTLCVSCHAYADWDLRRQKESSYGT